MTSRIDRLITLLDTGSTSSVRQTAAKQLAGVARRSLPEHEPGPSVTQTEAWCEIYDKGWQDIVILATRVLPYLSSKTTDTRLAAVDAVNRIVETVPQWKCSFGEKASEDSMEVVGQLGWPEILEVEDLVISGRKLAATGEGEYGLAAVKNGVDEQAKEEVLSKLGLKDQLMLGDQDILLDDMDDVKPIRASRAKRELSPSSASPAPQESGNGVASGTGRGTKRIKRAESSSAVSRPTSSSGLPAKPAPVASASRPANIADDSSFAGISARQINVLKRKMKAGLSYNLAIEEAAKMRGGGAPISPLDIAETPIISRTSSPNHKYSEALNNSVTVKAEPGGQSETVIIDPAAKIAQNMQQGGYVNASKGVGKDLTPPPGVWAWQGVLNWLVEQLAAPGWESRHGAALALRDLLRHQGSACGTVRGVTQELNILRGQQCLLHVGQALLRTLILDRFGDFVGDQVVAPVREAAAQALGSVLRLMSRTSVSTVHSYLMDMIAQPWSNYDDGKRKGYAWEVRHAGLLGLMYEVAVRPDIVTEVEDIKPQIDQDRVVKMEEDVPENLLQRVINAAMLGLRDADDDVRGVAATCLLPIALSLPSHLPQDQLEHLLEVLWSCLDSREDDLGSSTASVMDLLSRLVSSSDVIKFYALDTKREGTDARNSLATLVPLLFPFFRHTIAGVRLAAVKALAAFLDAADLRKDWLDSRLMRLLYQNLILEERSDVREVSVGAWHSALRAAEGHPSTFELQILPHFVNWFSLALTPVNGPLPAALLLRLGRNEGSETYDVDKSIVAGDLSLISIDIVIRNRIEAVQALARISCGAQDAPTALGVVNDFTVSTSGHQLFLCGVYVEEKAIAQEDFVVSQFSAGGLTDQGERALVAFMDLLGNGFRLPHYFESANLYSTLQRSYELALESVSTLKRSGPHPKVSNSFSIEAAKSLLEQYQHAAGHQEQLSNRMANLSATLERHEREKISMDVRVLAAAAGAVIATRMLPPKLNPLIQKLMRGVKSETNALVQRRFARALASLIKLCVDPDYGVPPVAANKILMNLTSFLCQDEGFIPQVSASPAEGIVTHRLKKPTKTAKSTSHANGDELAASEGVITRRGAQAALSAVIDAFGADVFDKVPKLWDLMTQELVARFPAGGCDISIGEAQEVVDCICVLQAIGVGLPASLLPRLQSLLPNLLAALQSNIPLVRHVAAVTFARLCKDITLVGMTAVVEDVVPLLGDAPNRKNRQGAIELIHHIILQLDVVVLPYILFLLVPVMGRMSDTDEDVRLLATNTFASLIRLVPLEEDIPDPEGFPQEMMERRESQRSFLRQLLDGSQVEPYVIPVDIKAELRHYQQDGVSWLAFLCKYQLHGILCDDMGLGKSLQTICIVASKHEERRKAYTASRSVESQPLPSLIVCPPTLVGHWFHEFKKFAPHLPVLRYAGNARERQTLRGSFSGNEIIITSYEVIRSEGDFLNSLDWLFCVLDEGHIIKNGKTKLSKAIKMLKANHRLILSGTPIQNNVLELWNLFDFLMPGFLGTEKQFSDRFSKPILANRSGKATPKEQEAAILALDALHKQVLPFLLRRLKEDVLDDLPPKIIQDYYCELSLVQKRLYDEFARSKASQQAGSAVSGATTGSGEQQHVFQTLQYLRKLCNHPWLALNQQTDQLKQIVKRAWTDASLQPPADVLDIIHAPKLVALRQILLDCGIGAPVAASDEAGFAVEATSQHRVLIFCQTKQMLDIIERDLFAKHMPSVTFMRLDGNTEASKRHDIVQTFNADPSVDVLLLTTQVGGLGLNLTGADTVVFVDHDWNPMKDLQAMDRAHRIGQKKVVNVYRLIMRGTLEEKIMGLQRFKLNIASSVVNEQNAGLTTMNTNQVLDLFDVTDSETTALASKTDGAVSQSDFLKGLEDLPPETEYEGLSLDAYMSTM